LRLVVLSAGIFAGERSQTQARWETVCQLRGAKSKLSNSGSDASGADQRGDCYAKPMWYRTTLLLRLVDTITNPAFGRPDYLNRTERERLTTPAKATPLPCNNQLIAKAARCCRNPE
jgi:hypothetical protein